MSLCLLCWQYAERHLETRLIAKLNELLVKFDALRDRLTERDKLRAEVESLGKQVEASKRTTASSKAVGGQGEKHFEVEAAFQERRDEYTAKHSALLRELQQYNENRLDILAAILLDFFAAQKFFAYAYGRSLFRLHEQLREADERSPVPLPNPSWQSLMTYVTQTDETRQLQSGEVRPSLIMKLASEEYSGAQQRSQGAFAAPLSPSSRAHPPPQTFTRPDSFASPDDVQFNPAVLHDPKNQPYLPLSITMNLKQKRQTAEADPSMVHSASSPAEPVIRRGQPPPPLQEPAHVTPSPFSALHSTVYKEAAPAPPQHAPIFDAFGDGGPPRPPPPGPRSPPQSSAGFDILSMPFASPPAQPAPPPPPPPAPPGRAPGGPPPPPACRQPPPPASRAPIPSAGFAATSVPSSTGAPPPPPPRSAVSPPPSSSFPPPPASRQPSLPPAPPTPRSTNPWDAPIFPQPPPPSSRPPPSPSHAVSPRGVSANGAFGFPAASPPPPPASRAQPPPGPPPPKPPKEWTPFDDED